MTNVLRDRSSILIYTDAAVDDPHWAYSWFKRTSAPQSAEMLKQVTRAKVAEVMAILGAVKNHQVRKDGKQIMISTDSKAAAREIKQKGTSANRLSGLKESQKPFPKHTAS